MGFNSAFKGLKEPVTGPYLHGVGC